MKTFTSSNLPGSSGLDRHLSRPIVWLSLILISIGYFADIFIRSAHKLYWTDELFTVYLCRLPDFRSTWTAVMHGADFNPPLFYLLTRTSQAIFGHGLVATRLPEAVGLWFFCVAIFVFVGRRTGIAAASVAALLPFFTLAQYYAYEARPHGLVLGWCGLALICWQMATDSGKNRILWAAGFFTSLACAAMTHVFAIYLLVPFGCVELFSMWKEKKANWPVGIALIATPMVALPVYLPMFRSYRLLFHQLGGLQQRPLDVLQSFASSLLEPAVGLALITLAFLAFIPHTEPDAEEPASGIPTREIVLAIAFACLPLAGLVGVRITHGVFFNRYFLASTAGWAILSGFVASRLLDRSVVSRWLLTSLLLLFTADVGMAVRHLINHSDFGLIEPTSKLAFSSDATRPMLRHETLMHPASDEDILVLQQLDYIYLVHYAPAAVASRLYDGALSDDDVILNAYRLLGSWTHTDLKTSTLDTFLKTHRRFLVYGAKGEPFVPQCGDCIDVIQKAGFHLDSEERDEDGVLYSYESLAQ